MNVFALVRSRAFSNTWSIIVMIYDIYSIRRSKNIVSESLIDDEGVQIMILQIVREIFRVH